MEAAIMHKVIMSLYLTRRGKNVVDLSVSFRYSGLTNNAKLDLVRSQAPRKPGGCGISGCGIYS